MSTKVKVAKDARLHESTVKKVAAAAPRRKRKVSGKGTPAPSNGPVVHTTVQPEVWTTALGLADGCRARLQVISETEVLVLNNPR